MSRLRLYVTLKFYLVKVLIFKIFRINHRYRLGNFEIILPAEHMLPFYKSKYSRYDKFLPFLAEYFKDGDLIIDVGANVGDTVVQIFLVNNKLSFICIEPDSRFFKYLLYNIKRLERISNKISIILKTLNQYLSKISSIRVLSSSRHVNTST